MNDLNGLFESLSHRKGGHSKPPNIIVFLFFFVKISYYITKVVNLHFKFILIENETPTNSNSNLHNFPSEC